MIPVSIITIAVTATVILVSTVMFAERYHSYVGCDQYFGDRNHDGSEHVSGDGGIDHDYYETHHDCGDRCHDPGEHYHERGDRYHDYGKHDHNCGGHVIIIVGTLLSIVSMVRIILSY